MKQTNLSIKDTHLLLKFDSPLPPPPPLQERQGVCIGLSEIIQQTSRDHILLYMDSLLPTVRNSLCDAEEEVRAAAAQTFNSLHNTIGLWERERERERGRERGGRWGYTIN